ncbi:unnamed protein product [Paramecium primaurelia]|uniref:Uncharacterized protein n=1 Tax=Paramecium primaurelia TaxID=5886 RepID=A0A8S1P3X0_PARPR|nr:unnamed protein product [Paramecium primaurelia]
MKQRERSHAYLYKQICKHLDVPFSSSLLNGIQETEIVIVLDQISQQGKNIKIQQILSLFLYCYLNVNLRGQLQKVFKRTSN